VKTWIVLGGLLAAAAAAGDAMVLNSGVVVTGVFAGFESQDFVFETDTGKPRREHATNVRSITINPPAKVSAVLINQSLENVLFKGYARFVVTFVKDGADFTEPVTMLRRIEPGFDTGRVAEGSRPPVEGGPLRVISRGEDVDFEKVLRRGVVNVVHFHYAENLASVREGNYLETLARKSQGRILVLRVDIAGWKAPICKARELNSLPQFWFYGPGGRLVRKLTERFTETDIDTALADARRG
jgi:hypothetical protein